MEKECPKKLSIKELSILFLGGGKRVSMARHFQETGARMGIKVKIYSYELTSQVPIASVGEVIVGKRWKDPDLMDDLRKTIVERGIDIVLPFVDPAIAVASRIREAGWAFAPVSDMDICETFYSKDKASRWFELHGVPQPRVFGGLPDAFPVILKPDCGSASKGIKICNDAQEFAAEISDEAQQYLVQEYIKNAIEYTVDCYVDIHGQPISIVPRKRLETAGGEAVRSITVRDERLISLSRRILAQGNFRGPITLQFIEDPADGRLMVMEINPRFGGGAVTSICAGSKAIESLLHDYRGIKCEPVTDWEDGLLMTRYFQEVIFHADNS